MGFNAKVGSFNIDTTKTLGQTQAITGVGFTPKIVIFWWGGSAQSSDTVAGGTYNIGIGAMVSATSRLFENSVALDAQATTACRCSYNTTECIRIYSDRDTIDGKLDFSSFDADGFTLVVDDQFSIAFRVSYLALGGDDLTNVFLGTKETPVVAGNYDVTGVGFQPDALITIYVDSGLNSYFALGMATGASNQGVAGGCSSGSAATSNTTGYGYNGEITGRLGLSAEMRESFVSFIADGFTLNHLESITARYFSYICLKGGQYSVGDILTRTDGNDISETVGFQPVALLFGSANRALSTQDTVTDHFRVSVGAATSSTERACVAISDEDNLDDSETAYANYDSAVYAHIVDDAIVGLMDIKSIDSSGFTAVMDDTDPSECWVEYLAFGSENCVEIVMATAPVVVVDMCEP